MLRVMSLMSLARIFQRERYIAKCQIQCWSITYAGYAHNNLIAEPAAIYANERLETAAVSNPRSSLNFACTTVSENSIRTPWRNFARRIRRNPSCFTSRAAR